MGTEGGFSSASFLRAFLKIKSKLERPGSRHNDAFATLSLSAYDIVVVSDMIGYEALPLSSACWFMV